MAFKPVIPARRQFPSQKDKESGKFDALHKDMDIFRNADFQNI